MTRINHQFRHFARKSALVTDDRGLSTVEYVIILVLIAAAAVGTWSTFGSTIKGKIGDANGKIADDVTINGQTADGAGQSKGHL
jgi:Flp pilus assembly pilin Flp